MVWEKRIEIDENITQETQRRFYEIEIYYAIRHLETLFSKTYNLNTTKLALDSLAQMLNLTYNVFHDIPRREFKPTKKEIIQYMRYHGYSYKKIHDLSGISTTTVSKYQSKYVDLIPLFPATWNTTDLQKKWIAIRPYVVVFSGNMRYKF
jgi:uncharacterized protein YerC